MHGKKFASQAISLAPSSRKYFRLLSCFFIDSLLVYENTVEFLYIYTIPEVLFFVDFDIYLIVAIDNIYAMVSGFCF